MHFKMVVFNLLSFTCFIYTVISVHYFLFN
jgi:hypothetical protein